MVGLPDERPSHVLLWWLPTQQASGSGQKSCQKMSSQSRRVPRVVFNPCAVARAGGAQVEDNPWHPPAGGLRPGASNSLHDFWPEPLAYARRVFPNQSVGSCVRSSPFSAVISIGGIIERDAGASLGPVARSQNRAAYLSGSRLRGNRDGLRRGGSPIARRESMAFVPGLQWHTKRAAGGILGIRFTGIRAGISRSFSMTVGTPEMARKCAAVRQSRGIRR
jgi:hypothetical protein